MHLHPLDAEVVRREFLPLEPGTEAFAFFQPLLDYWETRRGDRLAPGRVDIDPLDLPAALLPHLLLIDVESGPLDFRYRLAGTAADTIHGHGLRGVRVLDLKPEAFGLILFEDLLRMAADTMPQFVQLTYSNRENKHRRYRVLRLPLCDQTGALARVLVLSDHGATGW